MTRIKSNDIPISLINIRIHFLMSDKIPYEIEKIQNHLATLLPGTPAGQMVRRILRLTFQTDM